MPSEYDAAKRSRPFGALISLQKADFAMYVEQLIALASNDASSDLRGLQKLMSKPMKQCRMESVGLAP